MIGFAADTANGGVRGDVAYTYRISVTEVTIAEFMASGAGSGNENYWNDLAPRTVGTNAPVSKVSLYEAMKYCNWLTSGDINNGLYEDKGGGVWGAKMDRATVMAGSVNYFALPTDDEWYKAAYFKPDGSGYSLYANGTDEVPTWGTANGWNYYSGSFLNSWPNFVWTAGYGGQEQNGTYNMMGNVWEWKETSSGGAVRGGAYNDGESYFRSSYSTGSDPLAEYDSIGFRIVAIPEPSTALLLAAGGCIAWLARLKQRF